LKFSTAEKFLRDLPKSVFVRFSKIAGHLVNQLKMKKLW